MKNRMLRLAAVAFALTFTLTLSGQGRVETLTLQSKALAGNLTGDPTGQRFAVYTPPGYGSRDARYPVVYLLHGIADSSETWVKAFRIAELLDGLIAAKKIPPVIVVMPNAGNAFLGSYYLNSPVTGRWADMIANEIVSIVDSRFRTLANPSKRAVVGHSMGGFGAIQFGMTRPDVFSVVYAISPCCLAPIEDVGPGNVAAWNSVLGFKSRGDVDAALQQGNFYAVALVGLLSAMSPAPDAPLHVDLPLRLQRRELVRVRPAFDTFLSRFPVNQVAAQRENLAKLRLLAMDFGYDDQFAHIPPATMLFSRALYDAGIAHRLDAYRGDHREEVRSRLERIIFPAVMEAMGED